MVVRFLLVLLLSWPVLSLPAFAQGKVAYVDPLTGMEFVAVPGGSFKMGNPYDEPATPVRTLSVAPFLIGRFEVTFAQYEHFCTATGRPLPADNGWGRGDRPVINVSWHDAQAFTQWLSAKTGRSFRLPSEAEWEYAARGGSPALYPWGNRLWENRANCNGCGSRWDDRSTAPVGSFQANGYGLYDVVGNVYEWCLDRMHPNYRGAPNGPQPWLERSSEVLEERIYRGGSFRQRPVEMAVSKRCWGEEQTRDSETGFRVVLER